MQFHRFAWWGLEFVTRVKSPADCIGTVFLKELLRTRGLRAQWKVLYDAKDAERAEGVPFLGFPGIP
jgi:hypothetical protein